MRTPRIMYFQDVCIYDMCELPEIKSKRITMPRQMFIINDCMMLASATNTGNCLMLSECLYIGGGCSR